MYAKNCWKEKHMSSQVGQKKVPSIFALVVW
jgi:hypothetical protein